MKKRQTVTVGKAILLFSIALATLIITAACASIDTRAEISTGQIFLYGEAHGVERMINRQLEIWHEYYHNQNMRHMFIEFEFFTAEFLNRWMQSDNDDILYELFNDWSGSAAHTPYQLAFFRTIKSEFPETVFHGVDIGHGFSSTGRRFLQYLRDNNLQGTERYLLTLEAIEQGKYYYRFHEFGLGPCPTSTEFDMGFRVTTMTENFIREFDRLGGQNVMGIFGSAHTAFGNMGAIGFPDVPTMAERLRERYGDSVHTEDLLWLLLEDLPRFDLDVDLMPIRADIITINGVNYKASYFGTHLTAFGEIASMSFWRLENAYDDFRGKPVSGEILPFESFPMAIELNQIFIVDVTFTDDYILRMFYRSDGHYWHGRPIVTGFSVD